MFLVSLLWRLDDIIRNFSNVYVTEKHVVGGLAPRGGHAPVSPKISKIIVIWLSSIIEQSAIEWAGEGVTVEINFNDPITRVNTKICVISLIWIPLFQNEIFHSFVFNLFKQTYFILLLRKLDANIKGAAHPGWHHTMSIIAQTTHSSTLYGIIVGQWLREVCVSFVQRPRTQTQSVYTVSGNIRHFWYVLLYKIILFKYFSDLKLR